MLLLNKHISKVITSAYYVHLVHRSRLLPQSSLIARAAHISVGHKVVVNKTFPLDDVRQFANLIHDTNPIHLDEEYARGTRFGARIVHGTFVLAFAAGVLGEKMPGKGTVLMAQNVKYPAPTFVDDTVTCEATVTAIGKGRRVTVHVICTSLQTNRIVLEGDFDIMVNKDVLKP